MINLAGDLTYRLRCAAQYGKRIYRTLQGKDRFYSQAVVRRTTRLGADGTAWTYCTDGVGPSSVVYSFGVGTDVSFDLALVERHGLVVNAFDPTPRSLQWLRSQKLPERLRIHEVGLASFDGACHFHAPARLEHVSFRKYARNQDQAESIALPVRRLSTLMAELGHEHLDILKMDIEGFEYEVIDDIVRSRISVDQILVEFHHRWVDGGIKRTELAISTLASIGFEIFTVSPNGEDFGFVRTAA